jgi:choline dehydrogenase-like flavoprotein
MIYEILPDIASPESLRYDSSLAASALEEYNTHRTGVLTAIPSSISYLPLSRVIPAASLSNIISHLPNPVTQRDEILHRQFTSSVPLGQIEYNFDVSNYSSYFKSEPGKKYGTMLMMLQYPLSKGSIHIPPAEPGVASDTGVDVNPKTTVHDKPIIDPQYYGGRGGDVDFEIMAAAQKFGHKICSTEPLSSIIVKRVFPPEIPDSPSTTEEDFSAWVRDYTITDWHPVGTCAMGGKAEEVQGDNSKPASWKGVVDNKLRVFGVKGLRVCDASIMPLQVSAHIQATVYGIAEKGAALILEDWVDKE